jgi:hypothetical protein
MFKMLLAPTTLHNAKGQKVLQAPAGRVLQGMSLNALNRKTATSGWAVTRRNPKGN